MKIKGRLLAIKIKNMNKETYEALKCVVRLAYESGIQFGYPKMEKAIELVEEWIEEVKKDY